MGFLWENGGKTMENASLKGDFYVISMGFLIFWDFNGIFYEDLSWFPMIFRRTEQNVHGCRGFIHKRHGKDDTVAGQCGIIWCCF